METGEPRGNMQPSYRKAPLFNPGINPGPSRCERTVLTAYQEKWMGTTKPQEPREEATVKAPS